MDWQGVKNFEKSLWNFLSGIFRKNLSQGKLNAFSQQDRQCRQPASHQATGDKPGVSLPGDLHAGRADNYWRRGMKDAIVEQVRRVRAKRARRFQRDLAAMFEDTRKWAKEHGITCKSMPPKRPLRRTGT
jgi:hypothetical protein